MRSQGYVAEMAVTLQTAGLGFELYTVSCSALPASLDDTGWRFGSLRYRGLSKGPMHEPYIDITLLVLLVLFFGIQQRNRPEIYFRVWLGAWVSILTSVALWEWGVFHPPLPYLANMLRLDCLVVGGLCFVCSFVSMRNEGHPIYRYGIAIAACACVTIQLASAGFTSTAVLVILLLLGHGAAIAAVLKLVPSSDRTLRWLMVSTCVIGGIIATWNCFKGRQDLIASLVLCEIYLCAAVLFLTLPEKDAVGRYLGAVGFAAWSAGYCVSDLVRLSYRMVLVHQIWTVPKHLVGFGMILVLFGTSRDESKQLGRKYKRLYDEFRLLFESNPHPMWIYEPGSKRFLAVNDAAVRQYGYSRAEFLAMNITQIRPEEDLPRLMAELSTPHNLEGQIWKHVRKNGEVFDVHVTGHDILFTGKPARFVLAIDISEREELNRELEYRAYHDALTGLPNRALLDQRLPEMLSEASQDDARIAILTIDVDRFKHINDTLGHYAGDECLKAIAQRLHDVISETGLIARTGGEEFTAAIPCASGVKDAENIASALLNLFLKPIRISGHEIVTSVSIGVAIYPDDGESTEALRKRSGQALFHAKRNGVNQIAFASEEIFGPIERARTVELLLRQSVAGGEFKLLYQPIYDRERRLTYFEALLRATEPTLMEMGPATFVPVAEECGLIVPIGRWAIGEACRQIAEWTESGLDARPIAVNVSAKQLAQSNFVDDVRTALSDHRVMRGLLALELTETIVMKEHHSVADIMSALSNAGVEFAIDDFGTGHSSLERINDLPIASLKIDRSFIQRIHVARGRTIVTAVIQIAKNLDLKVVAEGVETLEQYELLCDMGCDLFQGYYFSKPLSATAASHLLQGDGAHNFVH